MDSQATATDDVDDLYDLSANHSVDIDPAIASCYGCRYSTMNSYQPRRRLWLRKKWSSLKNVVVDPQQNHNHGTGKETTSSTSGSQTIKLNVDSLDNVRSQSSELSEEEVGIEHETQKVKPAPTSISAVQKSVVTLSDEIILPQKAVKSRNVLVKMCVPFPQNLYQIVDVDHGAMPVTIPDDRSVHSLDSISTVTMDPALRFQRPGRGGGCSKGISILDPALRFKLPLQGDGYEEESSTYSFSFNRQQKYHKVKKLPLLQTYGNSTFESDVLMWTNTTSRKFYQEQVICEPRPNSNKDDQNTKALTGKVLSYITTSEAEQAFTNTSDICTKPLIITTSPKKSPPNVDQKKEKIRSRRKLRSYQCEPSFSKVVTTHLIEI